MFDVKQLRVLRAVAEHGSFSAAGDALSYTQPAISQQEAELEAIAGVRGGRVRLSSFPSAGASLLPPAVALFTQRHPDVELNFVEQEPEEAVAMLRAAELEVSLVFEFRNMSQPEFDRLYEGIELRHLIDDPMYLALPRDHPAARKPRVRLQDVAQDVWIQNDTTGPCGRLHLAA